MRLVIPCFVLLAIALFTLWVGCPTDAPPVSPQIVGPPPGTAPIQVRNANIIARVAVGQSRADAERFVGPAVAVHPTFAAEGGLRYRADYAPVQGVPTVVLEFDASRTGHPVIAIVNFPPAMMSTAT